MRLTYEYDFNMEENRDVKPSTNLYFWSHSFGECSVTCGEGVQVATYTCYDHRTRTLTNSENCRNIRKSGPDRRRCKYFSKACDNSCDMTQNFEFF